MNRREFTELAAIATATAAMPARAGAQTALGQPHPPLVAEDDPAITVERPKLRRPDGEVQSYAAFPKNITRTTPGIVICMHIWGVDAQMRDTARRFAKAGFNCIIPDLYSRFGAPSGDNQTDFSQFKPYAAKLDRKQYDGDCRAAALYLKIKSFDGKLGVTGFCMGGHLALIQAIDDTDVFSAVAPFYGSVKDIAPIDITMPIIGSYGEKDQSIPAEDLRTWRAGLRVPNDIRIYPSAGHAFFDDTRSSYVASAADDAWKRTTKFFGEVLGLQQP